MKTEEKHKDQFTESRYNGFQKRQKVLAESLGRLFNQMSNKTKKVFLLLLGFAFSIFCFWMIFNSDHSNLHLQIPKDKISLPNHILFNQKFTVFDTSALHKVRQMKLYLDSLKITNKELYDSLMLFHPGLDDSLDMFIYNLNLK